MSSWRKLAQDLQRGEEGQDKRDDRDEISPAPANVPNVPNVPRGIPVDRSSWAVALGALRASDPPLGIDPARWPLLLADAIWLCREHGKAAAALGWTASDLFGVDSLPGWGGLADRLRGARRVTLTDTVGHWRSDAEDGWLWRRTLRPMRTIWEHQS